MEIRKRDEAWYYTPDGRDMECVTLYFHAGVNWRKIRGPEVPKPEPIVEINWSAIGACSIEEAEKFRDALNAAIEEGKQKRSDLALLIAALPTPPEQQSENP